MIFKKKISIRNLPKIAEIPKLQGFCVPSRSPVGPPPCLDWLRQDFLQADDGSRDYTRCILYEEFHMNVDWSEKNPRSPENHFQLNTAVTKNVWKDVKCSNNLISSGASGKNYIQNDWPWLIEISIGKNGLLRSHCSGSVRK